MLSKAEERAFIMLIYMVFNVYVKVIAVSGCTKPVQCSTNCNVFLDYTFSFYDTT